MPSRTSNKNKMHLPPYPPPAGTVCIPVNVPDDPQWIALFTGAIYRLSQQIWYDRDDAHTAKAVAAVWADIYNSTLQSAWGCGGMFDIRLKPGSHCIVQATMDGGVTWVDKLDMSACWKNGIKYNPATGGLGWEVEDIGFYRFPEGAWVDNPVVYFPLPRERATGTDEERMCDAAYAAAKVLQALYRQTWGVLINWANKGAFLIAQEMMDLADEILGGSTPFDAMIGIAEELHEQESAFQDGGFPDSVLETVQNILFCNATVTDNRVSFDSAGVRADFGAIGGTPYAGLNFLILLYLGDDGLNAAGNINAGAGNCINAPCASSWCFHQPFGSDNLPYEVPFTVTHGVLDTTRYYGSKPAHYWAVVLETTVVLPPGATLRRVEFDLSNTGTIADTIITAGGVSSGDLNNRGRGWYGVNLTGVGSVDVRVYVAQQKSALDCSVWGVRFYGDGPRPFSVTNCTPQGG